MPNFVTYDFVPKVESMHGGTADTPGQGMQWSVRYTGTMPNEGDTFKILLTDGQSNTTILAGAGDAASIEPDYCYTYNNKVYLTSLSRVLFCAIADPTIWNDLNGDGNGFVDMDNQTQVPENIECMIPFQGRVAFLARQSIQMWAVATEPLDWQFLQLLVNVGTLAKDSGRPTGSVDGIFLSDTGFRSLRSRETTGNAYVDDLGCPIDTMVRAKIVANLAAAYAACAVVEPSTGQYWCFFNDTIYVLSVFPSSKVSAWCTFRPRDSQGQTFVPEKFVVYKGQVFCRAGNTVYAYGGADGNTYDDTQATWELPWLDLKTPGIMKSAKQMNAAYTGAWRISIGMDAVSGILQDVWDGNESHTYDKGFVPVPGLGSHFKARGVSVGSRSAIFSSLVFHYDLDEEV